MQTAISTTSARLATRRAGARRTITDFQGTSNTTASPNRPWTHRCERGRDWRACGEGQATGQRGTDEDHEQCHIGTPTRTSQVADRAEPAPDHRQERSGHAGRLRRDQGPGEPILGRSQWRSWEHD